MMKRLNLLTCCAVCSLSSSAFAADVKRECIEASTAGQTSRDTGELRSARDSFLTCSHDQCPAVVRRSCARWLSEVEAQLPSIVIRGADASNSDITDGTATVDGVKVPLDGKPLSLDPGKHLIVLHPEGGARLERKVLLAAGEKSRLIELRVESPARTVAPVLAPSGGVPAGAWVLGGVGLVALGSFGYFGLSARSELNKLESTCSPRCEPSQSDAGRRDALIADVSLGVGFAALAGAVAWALLGDSGTRESPQESAAKWSVTPTPHGGFAAVRGHF